LKWGELEIKALQERKRLLKNTKKLKKERKTPDKK